MAFSQKGGKHMNVCSLWIVCPLLLWAFRTLQEAESLVAPVAPQAQTRSFKGLDARRVPSIKEKKVGKFTTRWLLTKRYIKLSGLTTCRHTTGWYKKQALPPRVEKLAWP